MTTTKGTHTLMMPHEEKRYLFAVQRELVALLHEMIDTCSPLGSCGKAVAIHSDYIDEARALLARIEG